VTMGRVIGIIIGLVVLFAIISNPQGSAQTTRNGLSNLGAAGQQVTEFLSSVVNNVAVSTSSSSSSSSGSLSSSGSGSSGSSGTHYYPSGGVETGDGSTSTDR
jgi:hypothetical protein